MTDDDIAARLRAVERALTDGDAAVGDLEDAAAVHDRLDDLAARVGTLAERVDALDATVQSLHGYVGELEHVNERVERRADAARAAVDRLADSEVDRPEAASTTDAGTSPRAAESDAADALPPAAGDRRGDERATDARGGDESLLDRVRDSL